MHAVRRALLEAQARAVGVPLHTVELPFPCPNVEYEAAILPLLEQAEAAGVECMAFGDLFLNDVRAYREKLFEPTALTPIFPIWGRDTAELSREMITAGMSAYITCIDPKALSPAFAGREYTTSLLKEFPRDVDPCGEHGEFHTFAHQGPMFSAPIEVSVGEVTQRHGFVFADLLPHK